MKKTIHIIIICLYFITSCFLIGDNKWEDEIHSKDRSFIGTLFSILTIPVNDYIEDSDSLLLFKDPKEEDSVVTEFYHFFLSNEFIFKPNYFYSEEKIKDPFFFIFSPPPLFS